jgi:predicted  nucleic acid-binding Zn-ribbon protein
MKRSALIRRLLGAMVITSCWIGYVTVVEAGDHLVRAHDKLRIKIFQFPELSGEYTVSSTGTVLLPPIGEIFVVGSSPIQISSQISQNFSAAGISDKPGATVEVLQSRPIYVLGDVQHPGEYAYRPGVTVLQAISLAGGRFRVNDPGLMRLDREAITISGDMRNLVKRYYHLVAQRSRLNAELALKTDIAFSAELKRRAGEDPAVAELLNEERSLLRVNVDALTKPLESLENTRKLYQREIEAVSRQIQANKAQWQSAEKELSYVNALMERGLTTVPRVQNLERMKAQIEMSEQGYQTLILRAQQNISQIEQKLFDLKSERHAKLTTELQRTRLDLEGVAMKLDTSRSLMAEVQFMRPNLLSSSSDIIEGRSLTIVRVQDGKSTTIEAEDNAELYPGDVLKVEKSIIPTGFPGEEISGLHLIMPTAGRN